MAQIDKQMKGDKPPYFMAAYYCLGKWQGSEQSRMEWFDKANCRKSKSILDSIIRKRRLRLSLVKKLMR